MCIYTHMCVYMYICTEHLQGYRKLSPLGQYPVYFSYKEHLKIL